MPLNPYLTSAGFSTPYNPSVNISGSGSVRIPGTDIRVDVGVTPGNGGRRNGGAPAAAPAGSSSPASNSSSGGLLSGGLGTLALGALAFMAFKH